MKLPTPHLEKLKATLANNKLPVEDKIAVEEAIERYKQWVRNLKAVHGGDTEQRVASMVALLNEYRNYLDVEVIFDSKQDFLYRQKGQIKLDNSVIEEFLPHLVSKCVLEHLEDKALDSLELGPKQAFSAVYFTSSLDRANSGGGLHVRTKDQDFSIARRVYLHTSYDSKFTKYESKSFYIAYVSAECKTNLDKTMFQEAAATAHDVKSAVAGARYFLLCEWLDMTPQSTSSTDIDEVLILRKAKRMSSNVRSHFGKAAGRKSKRKAYLEFLEENPFSVSVFQRLVDHIAGLLIADDPGEDSVLGCGYF